MLLFSACGYTPSAKFSREVVGEKISTSVVIAKVDPENSVILKDAVDTAIIKVLHASLTTKALSQTHLSISLGDPIYTATKYDKQGFIVEYRSIVTLYINRETAGTSKMYKSIGTYDFKITPNAVITDKQRFDAIKYSSIKAIRSFIAQISNEGSRKKLKKEDK
jgi:hypothetical protein